MLGWGARQLGAARPRSPAGRSAVEEAPEPMLQPEAESAPGALEPLPFAEPGQAELVLQHAGGAAMQPGELVLNIQSLSDVTDAFEAPVAAQYTSTAESLD